MIRTISRNSIGLITGIVVIAVAFSAGLSQEFKGTPVPAGLKGNAEGGAADKTPASAPADDKSKNAATPSYVELQRQVDELLEHFVDLQKQSAQAREKLGAIRDMLQKYHSEIMKATLASANFDAEKLQLLQKENVTLREELDKIKISNDSLGKTNLKYQTEIAVLEDKVKRLQEGVATPRASTQPAGPKTDAPVVSADVPVTVSSKPAATILPLSQPAVTLDRPVKAKVMAIDRDIAVIDAGISAGVKEKARLYIIRDGKMIATLKIMNVSDMSSGIIEDKKQDVQEGDLAVSEMPS